MIFDTHAHYNEEAFDEDREALLAGMEAAGVTGIVNMGASWRDVEESQLLAARYPYIYAAAGIHPDHAGELMKETPAYQEPASAEDGVSALNSAPCSADAAEDKFARLYEFCRRPKTVAVGEIGLDYHWNRESHESRPAQSALEWAGRSAAECSEGALRDLQKACFVRQLQMAKEVDLPVNIHSRDAAQDTFDIMKAEHAGTTGGIIHCFSSSAQMALEYVKLGYYIGIGGVVTFKNARVMKEVASAVPLDHIVVETDCPYLAPAPHRGKRNSSLYLPLVIEAIAGIKGIDPQEVEEATYANARRVYRLDAHQASDI
ncbi:MAG: TatD family hydrolase [Lachnospiraceae bacterium]|nr:TatD family hydrolase [Lachnospiraceae bacterium]